MKFVMDERVKHRMTGVAVLLSIIIIFLPAMVKHSNRRMDEQVNVSVRLPLKPPFPKIVMVDENKLLDSVPIKRANLPEVVEPSSLIQIAKAESLKEKRIADDSVIIAKSSIVETPRPTTNLKLAKNSKTAITKDKIKLNSQQVINSRDHYAVQIASFFEQKNAEKLLEKLQLKGYKATYQKNGKYYKVVVGDLVKRQEADNLKIKLAKNIEMHGFVIKVG